MEILVLHPGGLGDILLSFPAIGLLRNRCPAARITVAANLDHLSSLAERYADAAVSLSSIPLHQLYAPCSSFDPDLRFWGAFDRIVSWTGFGHSDFMRNLKSIHPDAIVASWRPAPGEQRHVSRLFVDSLGLTPGTPRELEIRIYLNSKAREAAVQWLQSHGWTRRDSLIAIHPGAGSKSKRWPLPRFIELARRLAQSKYKLLFILGPAEEGLPISEALKETQAIAAESTALDLLASVLEHCDAYVGNDSGISHLAAGLQVPSIVLFGPTDPRLWAPLGKHVAVLRQTSGCNGCPSESSDHTCLLNISVEEAIQAVRSAADPC